MSATERRDWNSTAVGWKKWQHISERAAQAATETMLDMAGVSRGDRVLDLATGLGDTAVAAARRVGQDGSVLATDGSAKMLENAAAFIAAKELSNVEFETADLDALALEKGGFDSVICRWGLMFAEDLNGTLKSIRGYLRPGGRFAAIVWGPPENVEVQTLTNTVLMEALDLPPVHTGKGTPFALSDRSRLEADFENAGYTYVELQTVTVAYEFASAEEYVQYRRERSSLEARIAHCPQSDRERAWSAVAEAARTRARPDRSIRMVNEAIVVAGQNAVQQYF